MNNPVRVHVGLQLTLRSRVRSENLQVSWLANEFFTFHYYVYNSPSITCPYRGPDKSSPHPSLFSFL